MKDKELYDKTISILVKAYLNDTLQHCNCQACAVGNIVAGNLNIKLIKLENRVVSENYIINNPNSDSGLWYDAIGDGKVRVKISDDILYQAKKTGYTPQQLANIELAFETADAPNGIRNDFDPLWMYNGLMSVVEVLGQIHEAEKEVTEETKLMFVK
jgi:hypothetical protein